MVVTIRGETGTIVKMELIENENINFGYTIHLRTKSDQYIVFENVKDDEIRYRRANPKYIKVKGVFGEYAGIGRVPANPLLNQEEYYVVLIETEKAGLKRLAPLTKQEVDKAILNGIYE